MDDRKPAESQVLNYQMVQYRLFPIVASALAFHFTGKEMYRQYLLGQEKVAKGDFSMLNEIHGALPSRQLCSVDPGVQRPAPA
jgi:acyl-CoA oxidase